MIMTGALTYLERWSTLINYLAHMGGWSVRMINAAQVSVAILYLRFLTLQ